ncbi:Deoxyuridine 5'-triphosphate nucleotidohydrolase [Desulfurella amilsii]|uniref:Deoxyuridine 5'-triphosphate nucleotidohydrolase n=1 Tax=Desulfurella amilsii TaxID=1562698 RepID=A0A1X4XZA3_9BACT|nr:dUTP diphosphatase [Desulfurella amilsii]OSS42865.1 Deoxyuridine 5'-triphosphate nucleotidohydrolase [Desulfurella amilsii]
MITIFFKKLNPTAILPDYQTQGSSGMDLRSIETLDLGINEIKLVSTGLAVEIPQGFEGQIRPRSGLALKGVTVLNTPGTIDSDYRGEIKIILANFGKEYFHIQKGDRIAQLVIVPVVKVYVAETKEFNYTERGSNGFGSTGVK